MASETCTTMIIYPDFKSDSPLESLLETTSSSASDVSISKSEDQTYVVQPINAAIPKNSLQNTFDPCSTNPLCLNLFLNLLSNQFWIYLTWIYQILMRKMNMLFILTQF